MFSFLFLAKVQDLEGFCTQDADRPTSNPLPPQSEAFSDYLNTSSAQEVLESVAKEVPNFGTEQVQHSSLLNAIYIYLRKAFFPC